MLLCILRNENDPTTKFLHKLKVDYDGVKEQFKFMITSDDDMIDAPTSESFPSDSEDAMKVKKVLLVQLQTKKEPKNLKLRF